MSSKNKNLSETKKINANFSDIKIGVVTSDWNESITSALKSGCLDTLKNAGILEEQITCLEVPGAFELPFGARLLLSNQKLDGVVCLGCVIKGETSHDIYINQSVSNGIMQLSLTSGKPIIYGVLTPNDMEQALNRAGGKYGNKGVEAANTLLQLLQIQYSIKHKDKKIIGF